jgi:DNA polymerase-1
VSRTLLIDGDTLIFEAATANEYETQWDTWLWTLHGDFEEARAQLDGSLKEITERLNGDRIIIALSDEARWRPAIMPEYKSQRRKTRKPITYQPLRQYIHETCEVFQRPSLEGDDVLGILATHPKFVTGEKIIVSLDKDMKTLPGLHVNYSKARGADNWESFVCAISEKEADRFHMFQTLTGDTSDGYKGCPGIGEVKAEKLLALGSSVREWWPTVVGAYQKAGLGEAVALQNARVARICRAKDYDYQKKEVILWTPAVQ